MDTGNTTARMKITGVSSPVPRPALFAPATASAGPKVCVIAEIGVNHDGDVDRAIALLDAAKTAGASAAKLQLFDPDALLAKQATLAAYQRDSDDDVHAMLKRLQLDGDDMHRVRAAARKIGMPLIVTPFSLEVIPLLDELNVDAVKIASPDVVNMPLLEAAAALGKPMVVSTGAAELNELEPAAQLLRDRPSCLLHCVSSYPTPTSDATLGAMAAIRARFNLPVGYSDHTGEMLTGALAVAAGGCVIEKHLTYDRNAAGPDHASSFDARQFGEYVALIEQAAMMMGPQAKHVGGVEREVRTICRQSVCAVRDLSAGHVLQRGDLTVKRPGTGIPAAELHNVIGQRLARNVEADSILRDGDLA